MNRDECLKKGVMKIRKNAKGVMKLSKKPRLGGEYYGRNNNIQSRRKFDERCGLVLWSGSKQGIGDDSKSVDSKPINLSKEIPSFHL